MTSMYRMSCMVLIVLLLLQLIPFSAYAASSSEIKRQIDALKEQKKEIEGQIEDVKEQYQQNENEIANIIARKNVIDQEINLLAAQIRNIDEQIIRGLATAGIIDNLTKQNASISGQNAAARQKSAPPVPWLLPPCRAVPAEFGPGGVCR